MISVIVVEDNTGLREDIVFALNAEGLRASGAANGAAFDRLCLAGIPNVVVLDWMLPDEDGLSIARRLRARKEGGAGVPGIVMLTARGAVEDRVAGLDLSDAYLIKPVDMRELVAVIRSVNRRLAPSASSTAKPNVWHLDSRKMTLVSPHGDCIDLTYNECTLLSVLSSAGNKPVPTRTMIEAMGEDWMSYEKNRLELMLSRLRQKIQAAEKLKISPIKVARNEGYLLTIRIVPASS